MKTYPSILFYVASVSLVAAGSLFNTDTNLWSLLLLIWCNVGGTYLIYKLPSIVKQKGNFSFKIKLKRRSPGSRMFVYQYFFVTLPLSLFFLSLFQITMLAIVCVMGLAYAYEFKVNKKRYMLKKIFMIKNLLIGLGWGALILIGYDGWDSQAVNSLFVFTSIQVFVGSIIRDLQDYSKDKKNNVNTLPVVLGKDYTLTLSHIINILSFVLAVLISCDAGLTILFLIVIIWKTINLLEVGFRSDSKLWGQKLNLATCFVIFLVLIIEAQYAII